MKKCWIDKLHDALNEKDIVFAAITGSVLALGIWAYSSYIGFLEGLNPEKSHARIEATKRHTGMMEDRIAELQRRTEEQRRKLEFNKLPLNKRFEWMWSDGSREDFEKYEENLEELLEGSRYKPKTKAEYEAKGILDELESQYGWKIRASKLSSYGAETINVCIDYAFHGSRDQRKASVSCINQILNEKKAKLSKEQLDEIAKSYMHETDKWVRVCLYWCFFNIAQREGYGHTLAGKLMQRLEPDLRSEQELMKKCFVLGITGRAEYTHKEILLKRECGSDGEGDSLRVYGEIRKFKVISALRWLKEGGFEMCSVDSSFLKGKYNQEKDPKIKKEYEKLFNAELREWAKPPATFK